MSVSVKQNTVDDNVDEEIYACLNPDSPKSFFLFAGAGSGKTRSLVNVLQRFKNDYGKRFRLHRKKIAIITYTNAASDEITRRLEFDSIFSVSTIHSFAWEAIKHYTFDIREWLRKSLSAEINTLNAEQSKSRDLGNKTSVERAAKIKSKSKRFDSLDSIVKFTYNPNGDNITRDSLNHTEVISIAAHFITNLPLMQDIVISRFPVILIDESQDTKRELIDAFFLLQQQKKESFSLGLFGDTMQRIYMDGKENLGRNLPQEWITPAKKMNHRSGKKIIRLINNIRKGIDGQEQQPRTDKEDGFVRLFIVPRNIDKQKAEVKICERMMAITNDSLWHSEENKDVKTLILEHHMAARRMGFFDFFAPLYEQDRLRTGLLDGTLPSLRLFTKIILPLIEAHITGDQFEVTRIVKANAEILTKEQLVRSEEQLENVKKAKKMLESLLQLWDNGKDPLLKNVLQNIFNTRLFSIPESLVPVVAGAASINGNNETPEQNSDEITPAWRQALEVPFSQLKMYSEYLSEKSKFGTHQGVKGLEYERVMVIIDDEEAKGFLFSYDKLFGAKGLTDGDRKNISEGKETGIDRTKRLFYVACSRAKSSLAIVAYTDSPAAIKQNAIDYGWFEQNEIETV
ncbi:MAG: ATP-dependent helicase [Hydrotalea sp. AMD]|uniref:UvrD-helicase domain-containing protein n=1 Tax=Hydrotalea TaxID=1004300 RepID=UPI00082BF753|nr:MULTISPECIES: UvrD-helicase domain-containing protein [Hydrotalea]RTL53320.1 MAG: ATP-dependent helicase [Sphingobacteriales bacterium]RWZ86238.1 MAG: ATP-dependent helicase [Hydrotalea sp. AMD]